MKGTRILVTSKPRGVFEDCYVSGTPKPGTVMQIKAATAAVGGLFTMEVFNADADGDQRMIAVLLEKDQEGKIYSDAYVDGDLGRVYFPLSGEKLNMLFENVSGTGDDVAIGDLFEVDDSLGTLHATASGESEPFVALEATTDPMAAHWEMCMFTGY